MSRQRESFKKMHPEQFSDSKIIQKGKLDRNFLDFYFETLTSKSLEKDFEEFCRHIAEKEICPNLLPQTGPTGGGDSKVDSETYPVAESISILWYLGEGNRAATERWAFAISAKKEWKSKVKSDIEKIARVNSNERRGYTKAFFLSNQYISDRKRADTEAELRQLFDLEVRILDRTWLLDKALKNAENIEVTIKSFGLSESFYDEMDVGERDYSRKKEYEQIEQQLKKMDIKSSEMINLSRCSLILAREMEVSEGQILDLIERNCRIAKEHGSIVEVADSIYDAAWTIYWWYFDLERYYDYYKKYENIAIEENNVNLFNNLITLWINLYSVAVENKEILLENHTKKVEEKYKQYISDSSKPNTAIEAKAAYQLIRFFLGDDIDDIADDIIQIVDESFGHLDLNLYSLKRIVREFPVLEKAKRYDELFEKMIALVSEQKQKSELAQMLVKRGQALANENPYEALGYFSRSLMNLYNDENKPYLVAAILGMADIFEEVGLIWAARNFYYYDFCLCLNQYMKYGEVFPGLIISANRLKYIELKLGHILYATTFNELENIAKHIYPKKIDIENNENYNFDFVLALQILRSSYEVERNLGKMPKYLEDKGLILSSIAIKHELGYYDEEVMISLNNSREAFDDLIDKWIMQSNMEKFDYLPWYGVENACGMQANLLGCSIELSVSAPYEHGEIEIGATILATIESFFGTGVKNKLISIAGRIRIELIFDATINGGIEGKVLDDQPNVIRILFREYESKDIIDLQKGFYDFMIELIGMVTSIMFPYGSQLDVIEKMIKNEYALERAQNFANSVFYGMNILGKEIFLFSSVVNNYEKLSMKRKGKSTQSITKNEQVSEDNQARKIHYSKYPEEFDFKRVSNADIYTSPLINNALWDLCKWKGVMFMTDKLHKVPPVLSLVYENAICKKIFEEWYNDIGTRDDKNEIGIRIIKGIDRQHPHWYRVIIGVSDVTPKNLKQNSIVGMPARVHTMQPNNDVNLKNFEQELEITSSYMICPSYITNSMLQPQICNEFMIRKKINSIIICNAYEMEEDVLSYSGILPTDNPIIPKGKEEALILKWIEAKKIHIDN